MSDENGNGELPSARIDPRERIHAMARRASREHAEAYGDVPTQKVRDPADRPTKEQAWQAWAARAMARGEPIDRAEFERWWKGEVE